MKLTYFTDEDVHGTAIKIARSLGVTIVTIQEVGLRTEDDDLIPFKYAIEHGYVMVTGIFKDYQAMLNQAHFGIIIISPSSRQNPTLIADELFMYYEASEAHDDLKGYYFSI